MKELDHKAIGLRIRKQRILLKLSREELAQKIGVSTTFLTDIELGTKGFSLKSLNRFSQVLKMSAETILYGSEGAAGHGPQNRRRLLQRRLQPVRR